MIEFPLIKILGYPKGAERGAAVPLSATRVERRKKHPPACNHTATHHAGGKTFENLTETSYIGENDRVPPNKNFGIPKGAERGAAVPLSAARVGRRKKNPPACNHRATHHAGGKTFGNLTRSALHGVCVCLQL